MVFIVIPVNANEKDSAANRQKKILTSPRIQVGLMLSSCPCGPSALVDPWQKIVLRLLPSRTTRHHFFPAEGWCWGWCFSAPAPRRERRRGDGLRLHAYRQFYKVGTTLSGRSRGSASASSPSQQLAVCVLKVQVTNSERGVYFEFKHLTGPNVHLKARVNVKVLTQIIG